MARLNKNQQEILINDVRAGDINTREELFNYYYEMAIKYLSKLHIPSDIKEDLNQEIAISILDTIDNYDFNSKIHISVQVHDKLLRTIVSYLNTVYTYSRDYNGKQYNNSYTYLKAKGNTAMNPQEALSELIKYGKRREDQIPELSSGDSYLDDLVNSSVLIDKYFEFASTLPFKKRLIFFGRIPICDEAYKSERELGTMFKVKEQRIGQIAEVLKNDFLSYDNVAYLLGFSNDDRVGLIRRRYWVKTML